MTIDSSPVRNTTRIISEIAVFCTLSLLGGGLFVLVALTNISWFYPTLFYGVVIYIAAQRYFVGEAITEPGLEVQARQEDVVRGTSPQEVAVREYLDRITELLLSGDLRERSPESEVALLARAQTLILLPRLDGYRKRTVVQFLYELGLINRSSPVVTLFNAELRYANLIGLNLAEAFLPGVDLQGGQLAGANLRAADLTVANLREADLRGAELSSARLSRALLLRAKLTSAHLEGADLSEAVLIGADLIETNLREAQLTGSDLRDVDLRMAYLGEADLRGADLEGADLRGADLEGADLRGTSLVGADLTGADLSRANLQEARITEEQLAVTATLANATMPDGSISSEPN